jgi:hypothetical protein
MGDARDAATHGNLGGAVGSAARVFSFALAPGWIAGGRRHPHPLNEIAWRCIACGVVCGYGPACKGPPGKRSYMLVIQT